MTRLLTAIFGNPDLNKAGLAIRGFVLAIGASSIGALLCILNQWANGDAIDWALVKQIFAYNVVPTIGIWFTGLQAWLKSQAAVSVNELNRMLEIGIALPKGATPADAKAIFHNEQEEKTAQAVFLNETKKEE